MERAEEERNSKAKRLKMYGDAVKNCMPKQSNNVAELEYFLERVDAVFDDVECPLRAESSAAETALK